jgi:hypothetical protein
MSLTGSDRRRLDELRSLHQQMMEVEMPAAMRSELDQIAGQLIGAAERVDKIFDAIVAAMGLLLDIYAYVKTHPAADDG